MNRIRGRVPLEILAALAAAPLVSCEPLLDVPAPGAGHDPAGSIVRIVTWNVHDLFDADDRLLPPGAEDDVPSAAEVDAKLDAVAAVLARLAADVVLLQEVETRALAVELGARAGYGDARLVEGNDPRGIDVAVLSRTAIPRYVSHAAERDGAGRLLWPRDCVEVHLEASGQRIAIVGSHLSSRLSDDGTRRAAQASRMRAIADAIAAGDAAALVVAGGDSQRPSLGAGDRTAHRRRSLRRSAAAIHDHLVVGDPGGAARRAARRARPLGRDCARCRGARGRRGARVRSPARGAGCAAAMRFTAHVARPRPRARAHRPAAAAK